MPRHPRLPAAAATLLLVLASAGLVFGVLGQSAPPVLPPASAPAAAEPAASAPAAAEPAAPAGGGPAATRAGVAAVPECDAVMVISRAKCQFEAVTDDIARVTVGRPLVTVIETADGTTLRAVPFAGNGLRQLLLATFRADSTKPTSYANPPVVSVIVGSGRSAVSAEGLLVPSRENSVRASKNPQQKYTLQVQRGPDTADFATLSAGKCKVYIRAPCAEGCPVGEADFGDGCKAACPPGLSDFGAGCVNATATACVSSCASSCFIDGTTCVASCPDAMPYNDDRTCVAACPEDELTDLVGDTCVGSCPDGTFTDAPDGTTTYETCVASCPEYRVPETGSTCLLGCAYANTTCAVGSICPGGTAVSAECADRSAFAENPCACTALQQLAALSSFLQNKVPWDDLANKAYCQTGSLNVTCAPVGGVQLPVSVISGFFVPALAGALPPSLGDLGSSLTELDLEFNAITSLPSEIGALTSLTILNLGNNAIASLPSEVGALTGLSILFLYYNAITSLPTELGALTGLEILALYENQLTGVPAEFRSVNPSEGCYLNNNTGFSCANVGAGTSCCTGDTGQLGDNNCGEGLSGGPCYAE